MSSIYEYTGTEWKELYKEFDARKMKNTLKRAYRKVGGEARKIAVAQLGRSGLNVLGNKSDWNKGIRLHIYSKGGGFMLTVKERHSKNSANEKSMHKNRRGFKKPILMWAEDGTDERFAKATKFRYEWSGSDKLFARHGTQYKRRKKKIPLNGLKRGRMPEYGFLEKSEGEMFRLVERNLGHEVETATYNIAKKAGFI